MTRWSFLRGGSRQGRYGRYALTLFVGYAFIISLFVILYIITPRTYSSGFTLILPGAGPSSTVSLETLGQASSNTASPYGSQSLSPTENYKRLFHSYRLRGEVAARMEQDIGNTPPPRIKLANQTQLIYVSVTHQTPDPISAAKGLSGRILTISSL